MDYEKLLERSDNWLKYAVLLHLAHEPKDTLDEIRKAALADVRIQNFLTWVADDPRFIEMIVLIRNKHDQDGFFTPESVYQKMKDWDSGQRKKPSPYLTYLCYRIFERLESQQ